MNTQQAPVKQNVDCHQFSKNRLIDILDACLNKTLGEVDVSNVFKKTETNPKITGIAGMVIEQSVLGYPADSRQEPDLVVDNQHVELKTTGIRYAKKKGDCAYEAKEPMSITAVSPEKIVKEEFVDSNFWHKLAKLLLVYYLYNSDSTVTAAKYADFPIKGYQFYEFSKEDQAILEQDWSLVRDFIRALQRDFEDYKGQYPRLSSELRDKLLYIDTAPKWPNPPRFRLKRSLVTSIVQEHFGKHLEQLPQSYSTIDEIEAECRRYSQKYKNKTINAIAADLGIVQLKYDKSIVEKLVVRMFGGKASKMQQIELFSKIGMLGKSVVLSPTDRPTEDMKLFTIDFDEVQDTSISFEESSFYDYFANHQFLYIVFKEDTANAPLGEARFQGFKRYTFSEDFIERNVKPVWKRIRALIINKELKDVVELDKHGNPIINKKSGVVRSAPNFPKSSEGLVFVRGTGVDATKKPLEINGVRMLLQNLWLARAVTVDALKSRNYV